MINIDSLRVKAQKIGVTLNDVQLDQFMEYYKLLVEWNSFMNLTAIIEFDEVCTKHFVDSLSMCKVLGFMEYHSLNGISIIDVGTGAGFPGIPLKIAYPDINITLLDSLGKRVKFLDEVIARLGLENIEAIHGRAEDFARPDMMREKFDICVSRAVASLSTLSEYCLPYVRVGGYFVSYKSEKILDELKNFGAAVEILGGEIFRQEEFFLPESDIYRNLFVIKKVKNTPKKYPRKAGIPSKKPL